ncbi:CDP-6-deoxy-delta-3,4-glucoseen reductase [Acidithiobacillus thiooxidans]|jgi:CDP-4-dehydro-6-deoxyglucose reductase|uniref:CDP-6-deoxy-L-threo-D-glycero-4-hexulose-3-dehydrase reductase n=1 Tax=Acidithiobacillus thiooxidans ATCC 19377 TaxID=637390 RepID=A0A543Q0R6_ACITH|nr:CDP-6-deoxy-delta-3,4-glucoseen reductase [Acidithiobacillus thiooxidans]MBU2838124.1 CDP-6-deoxy-delta-3,4-glucoseen reductase [Acidithiobacillus thiooxidans]MBU2842754.1 CDP-6-deoxy-delta-3,4-glucoseen reductase [Acidithiobacillus thiooxidans]MDR7928083.1 CDP-6-deoxy-delta-3,4-glucoseen reductase [Acidithiobacillus thiooxidans]MDX5933369.1 CDP-6-deoxy-delta-3,4-glucoseen reductase [Acidithiobacillus thiooxidans]TQN49921.1 CDP-6-deoxy-L-threo-D-glycero-4-hexulose-3-dehydrase reductase [Aci
MPYRLTIEPSGHEMDCDSDETILESALRHGFNIPYSCRNGTCATCKGRILSGTVDYGDIEEKVLSEAEKMDGLALFCQAMPLSDLKIEVREIGAAKDIQIKTLPARVAKIEDVAPDVRALFLKIPSTERLQFLPGQYIDILLKDGGRRGFSLANTPNDDALLELHIKKVEGGTFTGHVFSAMKEKDIVRFEGPLGTFFVRQESTRPLLMVATGTGFAPLKGMLESLFAQGSIRPIHFYWGVRHSEDFYYEDLLQEWQSLHNHFNLTKIVSQPDSRWSGPTGYVTEQVIKDFPDASAFDAYICGHPDMVFSLSAALAQAGLDSEHIFADAFVFAKAKTS